MEYRYSTVIESASRSAPIAYEPIPTPTIMAAVSIDAIQETSRGNGAAANPTSNGKKPEHAKPAEAKPRSAPDAESILETATKALLT